MLPLGTLRGATAVESTAMSFDGSEQRLCLSFRNRSDLVLLQIWELHFVYLILRNVSALGLIEPPVTIGEHEEQAAEPLPC